MASWGFSIGSLVSRAPRAPVAVSPALEDSALLLANLGNGHPDDLGGFQWRSDGAYAVDFDLNLLAASSDAAHKPTGWADLLLLLAGTPGLPALPPAWLTHDGRDAIAFYRPIVQDIDVMPGEALRLVHGLWLPADSDSPPAVRATVTELESGLAWEGGTAEEWATGGVAAETSSTSAWVDFDETIVWNPAWTNRRTYRVVIEPVAAAYDADTLVYVSDPALFPAVDFCAIVGHNVPTDATVTLAPQPAGTSITLTPAQPSMYAAAVSEQLVQTWRLSIQMPAGNQPRPILGEVWIGLERTFEKSPQLPIERTEGDRGQVRVQTDRGRTEVLSGGTGYAPSTLPMQWTVPEADYVRMRDEITRLTGFGGEPMLLIPSAAFEGAGRVYHGRIGKEISYARITAAESSEAWRSFTLEFEESPFAAPGA